MSNYPEFPVSSIMATNMPALTAWRDLLACADDLADRDASSVSNELRLPFATHTEAVAALRNLRAAIRAASASSPPSKRIAERRSLDVHSCHYGCLRPECVLAQRDELVRRFIAPVSATE